MYQFSANQKKRNNTNSLQAVKQALWKVEKSSPTLTMHAKWPRNPRTTAKNCRMESWEDGKTKKRQKKKELMNRILTPRYCCSSCCTGRRRRANRLGLSSSALLLLSASNSLCPLFTLSCSSLVALYKRKAQCTRQVVVRAKYIIKTQNSATRITINEATP